MAGGARPFARPPIEGAVAREAERGRVGAGPRDERSRAGQRRARARRRRSVAAVWAFKQRQHLSWKPCVASTLPAAAFAAAAPQTSWGGGALCDRPWGERPHAAQRRAGARVGWSRRSAGAARAFEQRQLLPWRPRRQRVASSSLVSSSTRVRLWPAQNAGERQKGRRVRDGFGCSKGRGGGLLDRHCFRELPSPLFILLLQFLLHICIWCADLTGSTPLESLSMICGCAWSAGARAVHGVRALTGRST